jgi:hypothetical protein
MESCVEVQQTEVESNTKILKKLRKRKANGKGKKADEEVQEVEEVAQVRLFFYMNFRYNLIVGPRFTGLSSRQF